MKSKEENVYVLMNSKAEIESKYVKYADNFSPDSIRALPISFD